LSQKETDQTNLENEQTAIETFLSQLADTRAQETASFNERVTDQQAMIDGLDEVIDLFSTDIQTDTNIDAATAQQVLDLLNQIRNSLSASIIEDTNAENDAQGKYLEFKAAQEARLDDIATQLGQLATDIASLNLEITQLGNDIQAAGDRETAATTLRDDTQTALDTLTTNYNANKNVRSQQLTLLGQVQVKLTENPDNVQQFLDSAL